MITIYLNNILLQRSAGNVVSIDSICLAPRSIVFYHKRFSQREIVICGHVCIRPESGECCRCRRTPNVKKCRVCSKDTVRSIYLKLVQEAAKHDSSKKTSVYPTV